MDTSATVFGIDAETARNIGAVTSWVWLVLGYFYANSYTFLVLVFNILHFNHEILDGLGNIAGREFTIADINTLGMIAFEYFLAMGLHTLWYILV